jgi:hypothetical protein
MSDGSITIVDLKEEKVRADRLSRLIVFLSSSLLGRSSAHKLSISLGVSRALSDFSR